MFEALRRHPWHGIDKKEANVGGVCVEQRPGPFSVVAVNKAARHGDNFHAPGVAGSIVCGSLRRSHLHQILKNMRDGMPGTAKSITDSSGKRSFSKLRTVDPAFASAVFRAVSSASGDYACVFS